MSSSSLSSVHKTAQVGFSNPDSYERARPSYQAVCVNHLISLLGKSTEDTGPLTIVDLAAGTGKLTRCLVPYFEFPSKLVAVEPLPGMRQVFSQILPNVEILDGSAESIPLADSSVDGLFIGQAFHWFANESSLKEFHRVLKPGAPVAMIWNMEDKASAEWVHKIGTEYQKYDVNCPQHHHGKWREIWKADWALEHFTPLQSEEWKWDMIVTREHVWEGIKSASYIAILDQVEMNNLGNRINKILSEIPGGDEITYPHATEIAWSFKNK